MLKGPSFNFARLIIFCLLCPLVAFAANHSPSLHKNYQIATWHASTIHKGDTLSSLFKHYQLSQRQLLEILLLGKIIQPLKSLQPDHELRLLITKQNTLDELAYDITPTKRLIVAWQKNKLQAVVEQVHPDFVTKHAKATITHSLFKATQHAGLSSALTQQFEKIFGSEVDFKKDIRKGAKINILYNRYYLGNKVYRNGDITAAELDNHGKVYQAIRYQAPHSSAHYYTPAGKSLQKAFLRYPVHYVYISSKFNRARYHPVLHFVRPHLGVDFAANVGTPVRAASDGRVSYMARKGSYGNLIIIRHSYKYSTRYAHLSRFKKGLHWGSHVKEGQVVGFTGKTGLTTGPHLHYEFRVFGKAFDPLHVALPLANPIPRKDLKDFKMKAKVLLAELNPPRKHTNLK